MLHTTYHNITLNHYTLYSNMIYQRILFGCKDSVDVCLMVYKYKSPAHRLGLN